MLRYSTCTVQDCTRPHSSKGFCKLHYLRRWHHPDRDPAITPSRASPAERFWSKVNKTETCWLWTACKMVGGYGQFRLERAMVLAHRFAYELLVGPIPKELELDHLCRVRHCVNPSHLEPVTRQINVLRGEAPPARQFRQTHCKRGHLFDEENTYRQPSSPRKRTCRECRRVYAAAYWRARILT